MDEKENTSIWMGSGGEESGACENMKSSFLRNFFWNFIDPEDLPSHHSRDLTSRTLVHLSLIFEITCAMNDKKN